MSRDYNLEELEAFLHDYDIPKIKVNTKTFLGIAKQPHYENVLSNIYAFYFNTSEEHGLNDLFIKSFVELINTKTEVPFEISNDFDVFTEYTTDKGGRIDLLLQNEEKAIIIENKVYHYLNNDLDDYWNSTKPKTKKAVVLSLKKIYNILPIIHPIKKPYPNPYPFINITHLEFIDEVMKNSGDYLLNANDKYIVFLKDLYQNIINLSNQMETKDLDFYFKHIETLNDIAKLKFSVRDYIKKEVNEAMALLGINLNLNISRGSLEKRLRYYVSEPHYNLMFTVVFGELLDIRKTLWIMVELNGKAVQNKEEFRGIDFNEEEQAFLNHEFYTSKGNWAHFVRKSYKLKDTEIENLREFIANKIIDKPFLSIFSKLEKYLTEKRGK